MLFKCIRRKRNRFLPISQEVSPISDPGEVWGGIESGDGAVTLVYYSRGTSSSPSRICSMRSCGSLPSTVHPTDCAVPKISRIVPERSRAPDRGLIVRAMEIMSSIVMLPLWRMFFTFLRSRGGSFSACKKRKVQIMQTTNWRDTHEWTTVWRRYHLLAWWTRT